MADSEKQTLEVSISGRLTSLQLQGSSLIIQPGAHKSRDEIPLRQVIAASYVSDNQTLQLTYLTRKKRKGPLAMVRKEGRVQDNQGELASQWAESVLNQAYEGVKQRRRLKVLVNPHGGVGKGVALFNKIVEPILRAAGCTLDIDHTNGRGHAYDIAKTLPLEEFDAVLTVSGDGLVHEVLNGFAHHKQPRKALRTPVAPIPTGSGNGLSLNLLGLADGFDVAAASLNALKGLPMSVDVFRFTQNGKSSISFMSQCVGLMADLDIGTEDLRWMGDSRFVYGLLRGLIKFKPCKVQVSYKVAENDKNKMVDTLKARRQTTRMPENIAEDDDTPIFPETTAEDNEGWTTLDEPLLYLYAGKGPYVGRDLMAFPVSLPDDGLIDIAIQTTAKSSRSDILASFGGAAEGKQYWSNNLHYVKAQAYRIKPLTLKGNLAIDGEVFPFEEFRLQVLPRLATLLSPHGYYAAEFDSEQRQT